MNQLKILMALLLIFVLHTGYAQQNQPQGGETFAGLYFPKDTSQQKLELKLIEDFENSEGWSALMPPDQGVARAKKVTGTGDKSKSGQYVLGVKEWSYHRGYSWCDITPPSPIVITGKAKGISIWACGRNYRHRLEVWVKSYTGYEYPIDLGSLNFRGWQQMTARIPMYIPYYSKYVPNYRPLHVTRILIRHDPNEITGTYYLYLDNLEAIVDTYEDTFTGDDMVNEMGMERWEEIPAATKKEETK